MKRKIMSKTIERMKQRKTTGEKIRIIHSYQPELVPIPPSSGLSFQQLSRPGAQKSSINTSIVLEHQDRHFVPGFSEEQILQVFGVTELASIHIFGFTEFPVFRSQSMF